MNRLFPIALVLLAASPASGEEWKLVWSDEFSEDGLPDPSKWDYETGFVRNNERQFYTAARKENARVEGGLLVVEARKERWRNPAFDPEGRGSRRRESAEYTSASLITRGKAAWTYGRIEVRAKLPSARGTWPAIWTLGTNIGEVGWPACGEIDIMELVGFALGVIHANIHTRKYNHVQGTHKGDKIEVPDASEAFHVYAIEWDAERIDFFVDGRKYFTFRNEGTGPDGWPYDENQYLILNLAIGGSWGGQKGIDDAAFPQRFYVDYVRVYQKAARDSEARPSGSPEKPAARPARGTEPLAGAALGDPARWPSWRGAGATGSAVGGAYAVRFGAGEGLAWKAELPGVGRSTPIVWDDHIFVSCPAGGQDALLDFDRSGNRRWLTPIGKERRGKHRNASGSNPSPVTDGRLVFAYYKSGNLAALDLKGRIQWSVNLQERFGEDTLWWDIGTSPVLTEKLVVVAVIHTGEAYLAAFEKAGGHLAWKVARNYECALEGDQSYSTPLVTEHGGRDAIVVWGAEHLTAHDAVNGATLWTCGGFNPERRSNWVTVASPVIAAGNFVVPYGRGAFLAAVRPGGSGDVTETHRAWTRPDAAAFVPTPAVHEGLVYVLRDRGEVECLEAKSGEVAWTHSLPQHRASYYSSPVIAGGKLYAAREDGAVFVLQVEGGVELLAENDMGERMIASPVPVGGQILLRGERHLFCVARPGPAG